MESWEDASEGPCWGVAVQISAPGLTGKYQAYLDLRPGMFTEFDDGFEPVIAASEVARLMAELATFGDEQAQLDRLGWTVRTVGGEPTATGVVLFVYSKDDFEERQWIVAADGGRFYTLPAYPNWTVGHLPALARLYMGMLRYDALHRGPSDQVFSDDIYTAEAATVATALGELLGQVAIQALQACRANRYNYAADLVQAFLEGFHRSAGTQVRPSLTAHDLIGASLAAEMAQQATTAVDHNTPPPLVLYYPDQDGAYYLADEELVFVPLTQDGFLDFTAEGLCEPDRCDEGPRLAQEESRALLSRPDELANAPGRVLVWLADPTNGYGYFAHWTRKPCWECSDLGTDDAHDTGLVPCTRPAMHAQATITTGAATTAPRQRSGASA